MAGGNDICQEETIGENFKADLKTRLEETLQLVGPDSNLILMSTIPDIDQVVNELQCPVPASYREFVLDYMCPNHDKLTSDEFQTRLELLGEAIAEVAADSEFNVVFDDHLIYDTTITNDQVSNLDCFHPTVQGQQDIADTLWPLVAPYFE